MLLSLQLTFTCVMFLFPMSESLEAELFDPKSFGQLRVESKRSALRTVICVAIAGVAMGIPDFAYLTGLSGGFGNNIIGFVLPPVRGQTPRGWLGLIFSRQA